MNKDILTSAIEKYHLGGNVESTKWVIKDKTLSIRFLSENKNLVGILETPNFDLEDCELPVYSTTQLYKLVKITDNFVQLGITKGRANIVNELNISDNQYDLHYHLADAAMIEEPDTINEPSEYDCVITMSSDFITRFTKAKKALGNVERFTVETVFENDETTAMFILGGEGGYSNKIKFNEPCQSQFGLMKLPFEIELFTEALDINSDFTSGEIHISSEGLMKIHFESPLTKVDYFLVRLQ
jgi:hypothetical protein